MLVVENGTLYTPDQVIQDGAVLMHDRCIRAVGKRSEMAIPPGARRLDAHGGFIVPGFVDMHMHGVRGYDIMDEQVSSLQAISSALPHYGVTSFVPTTVTATLNAIEAALQAARQAQQMETVGAEILGVHVEGPYLSARERGAHRPDLLRTPQPKDYAVFLKYADIIRSFTLAPELPGALGLISALRERDILVSAGHSDAIDTEVEHAVEAGLSHVVHMFGNMGTLRRVNLRRVAGLVESTLLDDRLTTEIIGDGYHISPSLMKLVLKVKGPERLAVVTDSSPLTGLPPGSYSVWGVDVVLEESVAYVNDRSAYAGSVATMDQCLRRTMQNMDVSLQDALRMVSLTPATILGIADRKGSLQVGKDADIVILDHDLSVTRAIVAGHVFPEEQGHGPLRAK